MSTAKSPSGVVTPRISVVIPSYNQAQFLDAAIRSALDQDHSDTEVIVMDGGSTDGSVDIIRRYEARLASWTSASDGGQASALKAGFARATGAALGWINSDDVLMPGAVSRVARAIRDRGTADAVFYGGCEVIDADGQVQEVLHSVPTIRWVAKSVGPVLTQPGTFFGRWAYEAVGGVDPALKYSMDLDLWLRFVTADVPFAWLTAVQGQFRSHSMQKGHSRAWVQTCIAEEELLLQRYRLAPMRSIRRTFARQIQRALRLTVGRLPETLAFRVVHHRRLRPFAVDFTA